MLNRSASLAMSTSVLKALPGKLDIKRHSPSILYIYYQTFMEIRVNMVGGFAGIICKYGVMALLHTNIPLWKHL